VSGGRVERRLAAVLAADVAGYSRLMGADEVGVLAALKECRREVVDPAIAEHKGRIVKTTGDGMLVEFASAVDAVTCAMTVQREMAARNDQAPLKIAFRVGINIGDIIIDDDDIFGDGVNVAARVENECEPGGVCLSGAAFEQVRGKTSFAFDDLGERSLKNIDRPIRLYAARPAGAAPAPSPRIIREPERSQPPPDRPSIAVLPFTNMSSDPEQEYFTDGMTEDIITELSRFKGLLVIARNSTFTYKGKPVDVKKIGAELGVKYVVEGSVRRAGKRVRITAQLIDAETGGHVWAEKYDGDLIDIFELQDQITRSVVATLQMQLLILEGSLIDRTASPSFEIWSVGKKVWKEFYGLNRESLTKALELARALARDHPHSAEGHKLVSLIASHLVHMGFASDPNALKNEAETSIRLALDLAVNDEHIYWGLGLVLGLLRDKFDEAVAALQRSIEINPNFALGYGSCGTVLAYAGRARESIAKTEYALLLNPKDPSIFFRYSALSVAYFTLEDYEQSLKWAQLAVEIKPSFWTPHAIMAASLGVLERPRQAREAAETLLRIFPTISLASLPTEPIRPPEAKKRFYQALLDVGIP
jgi:adenylate cyclase